MKKRYFLILFLLTLFLQAKCQTPDWQWARSGHANHGSEGNIVAADKFGNGFVAGAFYDTLTFGATVLISNQSSLSGNIFMAKYDAIGNFKWAKSATGIAGASHITTDSRGNCYLIGTYQDTVYFDGHAFVAASTGSPFLVKYDSIGNFVWLATTLGELTYSSVAIDGNDNIYVTGSFNSSTVTFGPTTLTNGGLVDCFLTKYDSLGNVIWAKSAGGISYDGSSDVATDNSGNVFITGFFSSPSFNMGSYTLYDHYNSRHDTLYNLFLAKYNSSGTVLWAKSVGDTIPIYGILLSTDINNNVYLEGDFYQNFYWDSTFTFYVSCPVHFGSYTLYTDSFGDYDSFLAKYDSNGSEIWVKGGKDWPPGYLGNLFYDMASDHHSKLYLCGGSDNFFPTITFDTVTIINPNQASYDPMFVICFDSSGNALFGKALTNGGDDQNAIGVNSSGDIYIGGDYCGTVCSSSNLFVIGRDSLICNGFEDIFIAKLGYGMGENVNEIKSDLKPVLLPNPFSNMFNISMQENGHYKLRLFDITSRVLLSTEFENNLSINAESLSGGIYILQVINENNQFFNIKVIKE